MIKDLVQLTTKTADLVKRCSEAFFLDGPFFTLPEPMIEETSYVLVETPGGRHDVGIYYFWRKYEKRFPFAQIHQQNDLDLLTYAIDDLVQDCEIMRDRLHERLKLRKIRVCRSHPFIIGDGDPLRGEVNIEVNSARKHLLLRIMLRIRCGIPHIESNDWDYVSRDPKPEITTK